MTLVMFLIALVLIGLVTYEVIRSAYYGPDGRRSDRWTRWYLGITGVLLVVFLILVAQQTISLWNT